MLIVQFTSVNFGLIVGLFIVLLALHRIRYNVTLKDAIKCSGYSTVVFVVLINAFILAAGWSYYSALYFWDLVL